MTANECLSDQEGRSPPGWWQHFHFHVVVLDGVFSQAENGEVRFHEAALLQSEHWHELQHVVQRRVLRYFRTHGLLDEADAHGMLSL